MKFNLQSNVFVRQYRGFLSKNDRDPCIEGIIIAYHINGNYLIAFDSDMLSAYKVKSYNLGSLKTNSDFSCLDDIEDFNNKTCCWLFEDEIFSKDNKDTQKVFSSECGANCKKCFSYFEYAEPNETDGSFVCTGCKLLKSVFGS